MTFELLELSARERFFFRVHERNFDRKLRRYIEQAGCESCNVDQFEEVKDGVLAEFQPQYQGPLADLFAALVKDFIENPEKWIAIIKAIIAMF